MAASNKPNPQPYSPYVPHNIHLRRNDAISMPNRRALRDMVEAQVEPRMILRPELRPSPAAAWRREKAAVAAAAVGVSSSYEQASFRRARAISAETLLLSCASANNATCCVCLLLQLCAVCSALAWCLLLLQSHKTLTVYS